MKTNPTNAPLHFDHLGDPDRSVVQMKRIGNIVQKHVTPAVLADAFHALGDLAGRARLRHTGGQWVVEGKDHQYLCETVAWAMDVESTKAAPDIHGRMCRWWIGTLAGVPVRVLTTIDDGELVWPRPDEPSSEQVAAAALTPDAPLGYSLANRGGVMGC